MCGCVCVILNVSLHVQLYEVKSLTPLNLKGCVALGPHRESGNPYASPEQAEPI